MVNSHLYATVPPMSSEYTASLPLIIILASQQPCDVGQARLGSSDLLKAEGRKCLGSWLQQGAAAQKTLALFGPHPPLHSNHSQMEWFQPWGCVARQHTGLVWLCWVRSDVSPPQACCKQGDSFGSRSTGKLYECRFEPVSYWSNSLTTTINLPSWQLALLIL